MPISLTPWLLAARLLELLTGPAQPVVTFASPGVKPVTLTVCDALHHCSSATRSVTVLNPFPSSLALAASPLEVSNGETLTLSAQATGRPPLAYRFRLSSVSGLLADLPGPAATWRVAAPAGPLTVDLVVSNADGSATARLVLSVRPRPGTVFYSVPPCRLLDTRETGNPITAAAAVLPVPLSGRCSLPPNAVAVALNATAISTATVPFYLGPQRIFPPTTSNLQAPAGRPRAAFSVISLERQADGSPSGKVYAIAQLPLLATFHLVLDTVGFFLPRNASPASVDLFRLSLCSLGSCLAPAGVPLTLLQTFRAVPAGTVYAYDLNGDGVAELRSSVPVLHHTYPASMTGFFVPRLTLELPSGVRVVADHADPVFVVSPGSALPAAPALAATYAGTALVPGLLLAAPGPTYSVADSANFALLGYAFYLRAPGAATASYAFTLPLSSPIPAPARGLYLSAAAINFSGMGPRSREALLP